MFQGLFQAKKRWIAVAATILIAAAVLTVFQEQTRSLEAEAARLAELLALEPGMTVGEVGGGSGEMSIQMARHVGPTGHVFVNELDAERLDEIHETVAESAAQNITVIEGSADDTHLPAACCDAIYMRRVYHHLTDPQEINASLFRALRPGGRLAVIDFAPDQAIFFVRWFAERPEGVSEDRGGHGVPRRIVSEELAEAGFQQERVIPDWSGAPFSPHFCVLFRR